MYKQLLLALLLTPFSSAIAPSPRIAHSHITVDKAKFMLRQDPATCGSENVCEDSCSPVGAVCCNDGSSTYCAAGEVCIPNACCPIGETCSGEGGGTITVGQFPTFTSDSSSFPTSDSGSDSSFTDSSFPTTTDNSFPSNTDNSFPSTTEGLFPTNTDDSGSGSASSTSSDGLGGVATTPTTTPKTSTTKTSGLVLSTKTQSTSSSQQTQQTQTSTNGAFEPRALDEKSLFGGLVIAAVAMIL